MSFENLLEKIEMDIENSEMGNEDRLAKIENDVAELTHISRGLADLVLELHNRVLELEQLHKGK